MEHLTQSLNEKTEMGELQLLNLKGVPVLSHLMYADDVVIFSKAEVWLQSRMHLESYTPIQAYKSIWKNPIFFCLVVVLTVGT